MGPIFLAYVLRRGLFLSFSWNKCISDTSAMFQYWGKVGQLGSFYSTTAQRTTGELEQQHLLLWRTAYSKLKQPSIRWSANSEAKLWLLLLPCSNENHKSALPLRLMLPLWSCTSSFYLSLHQIQPFPIMSQPQLISSSWRKQNMLFKQKLRFICIYSYLPWLWYRCKWILTSAWVKCSVSSNFWTSIWQI